MMIMPMKKMTNSGQQWEGFFKWYHQGERREQHSGALHLHKCHLLRSSSWCRGQDWQVFILNVAILILIHFCFFLFSFQNNFSFHFAFQALWHPSRPSLFQFRPVFEEKCSPGGILHGHHHHQRRRLHLHDNHQHHCHHLQVQITQTHDDHHHHRAIRWALTPLSSELQPGRSLFAFWLPGSSSSFASSRSSPSNTWYFWLFWCPGNPVEWQGCLLLGHLPLCRPHDPPHQVHHHFSSKGFIFPINS